MGEHTPGPWTRGEYEEYLGYDCMTGGIRCGPCVLDGNDYGQGRCEEIDPAALARMEADANLIAAAPDLLKSLESLLDGMETAIESGDWKVDGSCDPDADIFRARRLIAQIRGEEPNT